MFDTTRLRGASAGLLVAAALVLALLTACAHPAAVLGADGSQAKQPAATDNGPTEPARKPPFITDNPDGTFTIQTPPSKSRAKGAKDEGLVIPPQVVVPFFRRLKQNHESSAGALARRCSHGASIHGG